MPFDPDSGLVFDEVVVRKDRSRPSRDPLWYAVGSKPKYRAPPEGTETLQRIAMRSILCNIDHLKSESLEFMPTVLLEKIWKAIMRSHLDSLHVWQVFAETFSKIEAHNPEIQDCKAIIQDRKIRRLTQMNKAIKIANHPTCAWITTLDIMTDDISALDLASISQLKNLRRFYMATPFESPAENGFNDRVLRSWADLAREKGAFSNLKTIFIYFQYGISRWSLRHLSAFPALDEFCAYRCNLRPRDVQRVSSWRESPDDSFVGFIRSSRVYTHAKYGGHATTALSWNNLVADYLNVQTAKSTEEIDKRPMLNVPLKVSVQDGPDGLKILNVDGIVCLKRTDAQQTGSGISPSQSTIAHNKESAAGQPPPKRRRVVFDSSVLDDMMAG